MTVPEGIDGSGTVTDPYVLKEGASLPSGWTIIGEVIIGGQAKMAVEPPMEFEG